MSKVKSFHISWDNHLKFKDEIDPYYIGTTGVREVVSMGKTISYHIEMDDGEIIEYTENKSRD